MRVRRGKCALAALAFVCLSDLLLLLLLLLLLCFALLCFALLCFALLCRKMLQAVFMRLAGHYCLVSRMGAGCGVFICRQGLV